MALVLDCTVADADLGKLGNADELVDENDETRDGSPCELAKYLSSVGRSGSTERLPKRLTAIDRCRVCTGEVWAWTDA